MTPYCLGKYDMDFNQISRVKATKVTSQEHEEQPRLYFAGSLGALRIITVWHLRSSCMRRKQRCIEAGQAHADLLRNF